MQGARRAGAEQAIQLCCEAQGARRPLCQCEPMFSALSSILHEAVSLSVDNLGGLLFDAESSSTALANLREDGADLSGSDELHEAAKILCQAAEDDEQRKQLLTPDGNEVEPVFMELLLRSIRSPDVVRRHDHHAPSPSARRPHHCCRVLPSIAVPLTRRTAMRSRHTLGASVP